MIFHCGSLMQKFILSVSIILQSIQIQFSLNNRFILNDGLVNRNIKLTSRINNLNYEINSTKYEIIKFYQSIILSNIEALKIVNSYNNSLIYKKSSQDNIKLTIDFDALDEEQLVNVRSLAKSQISSAEAVDIQIKWCSQQSSGQLSIGHLLPSFKDGKGRNWDWNNIDDLNVDNHNNWSLFTIHNEQYCTSQSDRIDLLNWGIFFIKSEGKLSSSNSNSNEKWFRKNVKKQIAQRNKTEINLIIKGQWVRQLS